MPDKEFTNVYIPDPVKHDPGCATPGTPSGQATCTGAPGPGSTGRPHGTNPSNGAPSGRYTPTTPPDPADPSDQ